MFRELRGDRTRNFSLVDYSHIVSSAALIRAGTGVGWPGPQAVGRSVRLGAYDS